MPNTLTQTAADLSAYAIIVNPEDNVAVVKNETSEGLVVLLPNQETVRLRQAVPPGHRFATREIPAGQFVRQYNQPIGTSLGIEAGEWITHENMSNEVPVVRNLPADLHTPAPDYIDISERDRADLDVFKPRSAANFVDGGISALQAREIPERGRRRGDSAQQRLRMSGRFESRNNAADFGKLRRSSECRRRDFD
jgi:hypothetical protein